MANLTDGSSALKDDDLIKGSNMVNLDDYRDPIERKITNLSRETKNSFGGNDNFENEVKSEIKSIIKEDQIKTSNEEINDLARTIAKELGRENDSETKIEAKKIRIEIEKWKEQNSDEIDNFKKEEFKKDFINEAKNLNPNLKAEELNQIKEYGQLVSDTLLNKNIIDDQKDEALEANSSYGPGKLENSWTDLKSLTTFLAKKPEEIKSIKDKYETIKNGLSGVNLPNNRITRSFDNMLSSFNDQGVSNLFSRTQSYLGWANRVDKLTGGWLNKTVSKVGGQLTGDFAKNSLNTLAEQGFQKGASTILNGIFSGGVKAAGTTAAAGAEVAAGAAASATGVGAIVAAVLTVLKKIKEIGGKIAEKLGISLKKDLQEAFGKVGGAVINGSMFIVGLPALLIGMISVTVLTPILLLVFGGLFGYQILLGNSVSSLVPAKGISGTTDVLTGEYVSASGPVVLPTYTLANGEPVTGAMVVEMARSLVNKVCYWYGGGHGWAISGHPEPVLGVDPYWGTKIYNNPGSENYRTIYGPDCSGFVAWVFYQFGIKFSGDTYTMAKNSKVVSSASDLQIGDIGFISNLGHIGIFAGRDASGNQIWIHDGSGGNSAACPGQVGYVKETVSNDYFTIYRRVL